MKRPLWPLAAAAFLCACGEQDRPASESTPPASSLSAPEPARFGRAQEPGYGEPPRRTDYAGAVYPEPSQLGGGSLGDASGSDGGVFDGGRPVPRATGENPATLLAGGRLLGTFQRRPSDSTPVQVYESGRGGPIVFESGMTIDTDGLAADPAAAEKLKAEDPHHQTETAMTYANGRSLDPTRVPYIVLPVGFAGARNGDLAIVEYKGRKVFAVVGDRGPKSSLGEGSVALAQALGIPPSGLNGGVESGVRYTIFPNSGRQKPSGEAELLSFIDDRGPRVASHIPTSPG